MFATRRHLIIGGALALAAGAAPARAQARPVLKVGMLRIANAMFVGLDQKFFEKEGVDVEITFFRSGAELIPSLSRGQIDIAATSGGAALYNTLAAGVNSRIVGDYFSLVPGSRSHGLLVRKDLFGTRVKTAADLKGLTLAITAQGQYTHYVAARTLAKAGLSESDVRMVQMPYQDMAAALAGGAIDVGSGVEPYMTLTKTKGAAEVLTWDSDTAPNLQAAVIMYGERLNAADRKLGEAFMRGYRASVAFLHAAVTDEARRKLVAASFQKQLPLEDGTLYERTGWPMAKLSCAADRESLESQLDWYAARGLVRQKPDLAAYVDNRFVEAAR